jgi:hypothetical protein
MPQCQFPVSAVFVFQKSYTGNILGIGRNKSQNSYFSWTSRSPKQRRREARRRPRHPMARATPWPRQGQVWAPGLLTDAALPPIYSPRRENLKDPINFPRNILQAAAVVDARSGGSRNFFRHPAGEENHRRRPSSSPCLPPEWCVSSLHWTTGP